MNLPPAFRPGAVSLYTEVGICEYPRILAGGGSPPSALRGLHGTSPKCDQETSPELSTLSMVAFGEGQGDGNSFGRAGGGIQYYLEAGGRTIQSLIESGYQIQL